MLYVCILLCLRSALPPSLPPSIPPTGARSARAGSVDLYLARGGVRAGLRRFPSVRTEGGREGGREEHMASRPTPKQAFTQISSYPHPFNFSLSPSPTNRWMRGMTYSRDVRISLCGDFTAVRVRSSPPSLPPSLLPSPSMILSPSIYHPPSLPSSLPPSSSLHPSLLPGPPHSFHPPLNLGRVSVSPS